MRLKTFRASTVAQAMAQLRSDLGPEALILSTRRTAQGVELTAALNPEEEAAPQPLPSPVHSPLQPPSGVAGHGLPQDLAARLTGPDLARDLAMRLRFGSLPSADPSPDNRLLLAGLPGAGKTLCIARLATRSVLAGQTPCVITADGRRAGAAQELAAYTRLLGLHLLVADTPATLRRALASPACQTAGPVLIDTSGLNPFAPAELDALAGLTHAAQATPVLVMAAGQDAAESAEQAQAFATAGIRHLLATRLDLARRLGGLVAAAHAGDLILTLFCASACATNPPEPITPELLANRLGAPTPAAQPAPPRTPIFPPARARAANRGSADRHV